MVEGHDTPVKPPLVLTFEATLHVEAPPAGLLEVAISPVPSTATHSLAEGHETAVKLPVSTIAGAAQDDTVVRWEAVPLNAIPAQKPPWIQESFETAGCEAPKL